MKIDTNTLLILLAAGGVALYFFMGRGSNLNDNDQALAMQMAQQQQMNQQQTQALFAAMSALKNDVGASRDDNPWDNPQTWAMFAQTAAQIAGTIGSFI